MVAVYFVPTKLPRTWTRRQWKQAWRWKRVTEGVIKQHLENRVQALRDPDLDARIRADLIEEIVNPPLLLGPGMQ